MNAEPIHPLRRSRIIKPLMTIALLLIGTVSTETSSQTNGAQAREEFIYTLVRLWDAINRNNPDALGDLMEGGFLSSYGGDGSIEEGIESFRDPERLRLLSEITYAGCAPRQYIRDEVVSYYYICPPAAANPDVVYFYYRAGFRYSDGRWIFDFFVAGD